MATATDNHKMADTEIENLKNNDKNTSNTKLLSFDNEKNVNSVNNSYDKSVNNMTNIDENMNETELSEVQRFFHGKNVLITGATGFLGKVLVEKLLRRCPGVENLYLLVRQKRGKDIYTRVEEIFEDPVFSRLKEEVPKFRHKVVVVAADCEAAGLGLALSDRQMLTEKVNVIFHSAATVKFDEHLRAALATNVNGPLHILRLARDMRHLDVLMHISTAYSNCHLGKVEETFYSCDTNSHQLQLMVDKLTDREIDDILPTVLGPWPNTYTLTKALAENELKLNAGNIPLCIFRPAIVTSTAQEPLKGWIDNMNGPSGITVGTSTGILRTLHCSGQVTADMVPVDYVVNGLLVAATKVHHAYKSTNPPSEPPIFNFVSSVENPINWAEFMVQNVRRVELYPFSNAIWYLSLRLVPSKMLNQVYIVLLHLLPAALVDILAVCIGKKPKMLKVYSKIHKFSAVLSYFSTRNVQFCNRRTRQLWEDTSERDKELFPFSMASLDWTVYFDEYVLGLRRYLFKESDDTLPQARIKWKRLYYLHQITKFVFLCLAAYVLWSTFSLLL